MGTYLDTLQLRDAVIGDDVVLEERPHAFVLHEVCDCRAHELGRFETAADAWAAVDAVDDALAGRRVRSSLR